VQARTRRARRFRAQDRESANVEPSGFDCPAGCTTEPHLVEGIVTKLSKAASTQAFESHLAETQMPAAAEEARPVGLLVGADRSEINAPADRLRSLGAHSVDGNVGVRGMSSFASGISLRVGRFLRGDVKRSWSKTYKWT
jgi:hypothetical protein